MLILFFLKKLFLTNLNWQLNNDLKMETMFLRIECKYFPIKGTDGDPFSVVYNISTEKHKFIKFTKGNLKINWEVRKYVKKNYACKFTLFVNYEPFKNEYFFTEVDGEIKTITKENIRFERIRPVYCKRKTVKYVNSRQAYNFEDIKRTAVYVILFFILLIYGLFQIFALARNKILK